MRKILAVLCAVLAIPSASFGARLDNGYMNSSSYTATNETTKYISNTRPGSVFRRVVISTDAALNVKIYDSSGAASSQIANIDTSATPTQARSIDFDIRLSSGLTYTVTGNNRGITIIYELTHPR